MSVTILTCNCDPIFKQWKNPNNFILHKNVDVSHYILPKSKTILCHLCKSLKSKNEQFDDWYVLCPQYQNSKFEILDLQMFVTGSCFENESPMCCVQRELQEEIGINVDNENITYICKTKSKNGSTTNNYLCQLSDNKSFTYHNSSSSPVIQQKDDKSQKIQVFVTIKRENIVSFSESILDPRYSNDTNLRSKNFIGGVTILSLTDVLHYFKIFHDN